MPEKSWTLDFADEKHIVELRHDYFSGKRIISLDGKVIEYIKRNLFDRGSTHSFNIDNHICIILIKNNGFKFKYDLIVDNVSLESGERIIADEDLKVKMDEWKKMQAKGKIPYVLKSGAIGGIFQGLLFGFTMSIVQGKEMLKFYLLFGAISYGLLGIGETLYKWNKYKKMFSKFNDI